jgi:hypothetical protein
MAGEIHLPPLDYPQETLISESAQISSEGDQVGPKAGYGPQEDLAEFQRVAGILCVYLLALRSWQRAYSLWQATPRWQDELEEPEYPADVQAALNRLERAESVVYGLLDELVTLPPSSRTLVIVFVEDMFHTGEGQLSYRSGLALTPTQT